MMRILEGRRDLLYYHANLPFNPLPSSAPGAYYILLRLGIPGSLVFSPDLRCSSSRWFPRIQEQQELVSGRIVGPLSSCS